MSSAEDSDDDQRPNSQKGPAGQALKRRLRKWLQSTAVVATEANTQATAASQLASEAATTAQEAHFRAKQGAATAQEALKSAKDAHGHIHDMGQRLSDMSQDRQSTKDQSDRALQQCARVCNRVDELRGDLEVVEVAMSLGSPRTTSCESTAHDPYSAPPTDANQSTPSSEAHGPVSLMGRGTMPTGQPSSSTPAALRGVPLGGTVPPLNNSLGLAGAGQQQVQQLQGMNPLNRSVQPGCPSGPSEQSSQFFQGTPQSVPPNSTSPSLFSSQLYAQHTHPHVSPTPSVPPIPSQLLSTKPPVRSTQGFQTLHGRTLWGLLPLRGAMQPLVEPVPHQGAAKMLGTALGYGLTPIVSVGQPQSIFSQTYNPDCPEYGTRMTIWDRGLYSPDQAHMWHQAWGHISWPLTQMGFSMRIRHFTPPP